MAERRRLPVLSNNAPTPAETAPPDAEQRPPWHWAGFGVVAIFAAWLPLSYVGGAISKRLVAQVDLEHFSNLSTAEQAKLGLMVGLPTMIGLAVAAFAGGFVVGRFGTGPGLRVAAVSGAVTALIVTVLSWVGFSGAVLISGLILFALATGFAALGGRVGEKRRPDRVIS